MSEHSTGKAADRCGWGVPGPWAIRQHHAPGTAGNPSSTAIPVRPVRYRRTNIYSGGVKVVVRFIPAARPFSAMTTAIFALASSIISSPSITAPRAPPAAEVW